MTTRRSQSSWLSFLLALTSVAAMTNAALAQTPPVCGDCNGDGVLSILDALSASQHAVGVITIVSPNFELCDVEPDFGDGDVDVLDSLRLAQVDVGLFPAALCTPPSDPLQISQIGAPLCVGPGQSVPVALQVDNPNPDDANLTGSSFTFTAPGMVDVSSDYVVAADPGNPTVVPAMGSVVLDFMILVLPMPSAGPIDVDASVTGVDAVSGVPVDAVGSLAPVTWAVGAFYDDFEGGGAGWTAGGDWQLGTEPALPPKPGPTLYGTVLGGSYNGPLQSSLDSPAIDLTGSVSPVLSFTMWREFETPDWDGANIKASTTGGATFPITLTPFSPTYDGPINPTPMFMNPMVGENAWLGDAGGVYEQVLVDLTPVAGNVVNLRFDFGADNFDNGELGWYVDDMLVCDLSGLPPGRATNPRPADGATNVFALPGGTMLQWDPGALAVAYDVYFGTTSPPMTQIAAGLPTTSFTSPPLMTSTTYYWRVDSVNASGTTTGFEWSFTTGTLTGPPGVLINEVATGTPDYVEIVNTESFEIDMTDWTVEIHGNGDIDGTFVIPPGTILDPGGYLIIADAPVAPGFRFESGFNIEWNDVIEGEVILRTDTGLGVDYEAHNTMGFPNLPADLTMTGGPFNLGGVGNGGRTSFTDTDSTGDWATEPTQTPRDRNATQPFTLPSPRAFAPFPADGQIDVFPSVAGTMLNWDVNGDFIAFDVFLDTVSPPMVLAGASLPATNFTTAPLMPSTTYFWRIECINLVGRTVGREWSFTTFASTAPPQILINEVQTGAPDYVEIFNNEMVPIDISGYELETYNNSRPFGAPLDGTFTFPPGTVLQPCEFVTVQDGGGPAPPGGFISGFNISFTNTSEGEVLLRAPGMVGVDYVAWNSTMMPALPFDLMYSGPPVDVTGTGILGRINYTDTDTSADWDEMGVETPRTENPPQPPKSPPGPPANPQPGNSATDVVVRTAGGRVAWDQTGAGADSWEVFFDTVNPPVASLGMTMEPTILSSAMAPGTTYFWRVNSINALGATMGPVWSFTTTTSMSAIDPTLFINEMSVGAPDYIELISPVAMDMNGYTLEFYDDGVLAGGTSFTIGSLGAIPTPVPALLPLVISEGATTIPELITPFNIPWSTTNGASEVILLDPAGVPIDYAWCAAGGAPPSEKPASLVNYEDANPVVTGGNPASYRTSLMDDDKQSDWVQGAESPGALNPGQ